MKLFTLSILLATAAAAFATVDLSCAPSSQDDDGCSIHDVTLEPSTENVPDFPSELKINLKNCSIVFFCPELAVKVSNDTKELAFLDGSIQKVYLKSTLRVLTALRGGLTEIQIDPVDNYNLEVLDVEGKLSQIPENVGFLKKLTVLDLCQNEIVEVNLNDLHGLLSLRMVKLGHNKVRSISLSDKLQLPALKEFFLHGNELTTLDLTQLDAGNLQRFYVSQNHLERIEGFPENFINLTRADLYSNSWKCDWLEPTLQALNDWAVETLNYLPVGICDERGNVQVDAIECH